MSNTNSTFLLTNTPTQVYAPSPAVRWLTLQNQGSGVVIVSFGVSDPVNGLQLQPEQGIKVDGHTLGSGIFCTAPDGEGTVNVQYA